MSQYRAALFERSGWPSMVAQVSGGGLLPQIPCGERTRTPFQPYRSVECEDKERIASTETDEGNAARANLCSSSSVFRLRQFRIRVTSHLINRIWARCLCADAVIRFRGLNLVRPVPG